MATSTPITGPIDIDTSRAYLTSQSIDPSTITPLTGGTANFLFRLHFPTNVTFVLKHAEPYIASSNGVIPFPVSRMDYEDTALRNVAALIPKSNPVKVPSVYDYDEKAKVLLMSDGGRTTLKEAYTSLPTSSVQDLGHQLGEWLAILHNSSTTTSIGQGGNPVGKSIYRWAYAHLTDVAKTYSLNVGFCKYINEKYGSLLQTDDECLCHGDFWPGNVLLNDENALTLVDWEMSRRGCGATDVGQFAAETYLLDRFSGGKGLQDAFVKGYRGMVEEMIGAGGLRREFVKRVAVHMGVHLAYWPARVEWTDEAGTKEIIELGHDLMRRGDDGDFDWLGKRLLGGLIGD
ncbi:MAG: hypothetical protein Q9170_004692 [Blastenia crenularia]